MDNLIRKMLSLKTWAVVGSTHNREKYAYKVYMKLKNNNYKVYSINPYLINVDGDISYKTLADLPEKVDCISMVINPIQGKKIIEDALAGGIKYVWFQPGAETEELIKLAQDGGMNVVYNRCVLVELG